MDCEEEVDDDYDDGEKDEGEAEGAASWELAYEGREAHQMCARKKDASLVEELKLIVVMMNVRVLYPQYSEHEYTRDHHAKHLSDWVALHEYCHCCECNAASEEGCRVKVWSTEETQIEALVSRMNLLLFGPEAQE